MNDRVLNSNHRNNPKKLLDEFNLSLALRRTYQENRVTRGLLGLRLGPPFLVRFCVGVDGMLVCVGGVVEVKKSG